MNYPCELAASFPPHSLLFGLSLGTEASVQKNECKPGSPTGPPVLTGTGDRQTKMKSWKGESYVRGA